jgi:hypothetical protein
MYQSPRPQSIRMIGIFAMISVALALMMAGPAAGTPSPAVSREGYARCLKDLVRKAAEDKMDAAAFEAALAAACRDREATFKAAMVGSEVALGVKPAVAERGVLDEIRDYRSGAKEDFLASLSAPKP